MWTLIEALEAARPFKVSSVEAVTGARLEPVESNSYFTLWFAGPRSWPVEQCGRLGPNAHQVAVTSVDLRLPKPGATGEAFLVVGIGPGTATRSELLARHPGAVPEPPDPGPPGDSGDPSLRPWTFWVERPWGQLGYGVLRESVVSVSFHGKQ